MEICCCLLDPRTNGYEAEVLLIEGVSSTSRKLELRRRMLHVAPIT